MPKKILQKESPVLRDIAEAVPLEKIKTPRIRQIISEMKEALASQDDGVAIAAPQIGYSVRIFVVSGRVEYMKRHKKDPTEKDLVPADTVYINPTIKKVSQEKKTVEEGCLSVRYLYGKVSRGNKALIEAYDEHGKKFTKGASGLLAQIFQHEVDHLNGILFIDKAKYVEEILPEKTGVSN
jgi:peptide deformylase